MRRLIVRRGRSGDHHSRQMCRAPVRVRNCVEKSGAETDQRHVKPRHAIRQVLCDAVGEILLFWIATEIFERQNDERYLPVTLHGHPAVGLRRDARPRCELV